jgi:hypothetical protein
MNILLTDTWDISPQTIYTNLSKSDIILLENNNKVKVIDIANNISLFETSKYINHIIVDNNMIYIYKKKIKCNYSKKYITFDMIAYIENISNKKVIKLNISNGTTGDVVSITICGDPENIHFLISDNIILFKISLDVV